MRRRALFASAALFLATAGVGCSGDRFGTSGGSDGGASDGAVLGDGGAGGDAAPVCDPSIDLRTDAKNCGRCGHDCLGGACLDQVCGPTLVRQESTIEWVAFDANSIYYTRYNGSGGVFSVGKDATPTSTATTIAAQGGAWSIVLRDGVLEWSNWGGAEASGGGGLYRYVLATKQATPRTPYGSPRGIVADNGGVFFIDNYETAVSGLSDKGQFTPLVGSLGQVQSIAVDAHYVYYSDYKDTALYAVWKAGGIAKVTALANVLHGDSLAVYDGYLYFTEHGGAVSGSYDCAASPGTVKRAKIGGDGTVGAAEVIADGQACATSVVVDATGIYWSLDRDNGEGAVRRVTMPGRPVESMVEGLKRPFRVARDGAAVYWITIDGDLGRIALP